MLAPLDRTKAASAVRLPANAPTSAAAPHHARQCRRASRPATRHSEDSEPEEIGSLLAPLPRLTACDHASLLAHWLPFPGRAPPFPAALAPAMKSRRTRLLKLEFLHGRHAAVPHRRRLRHIGPMISSVHHMAQGGDDVPALYMLAILALTAIVFAIHLISVRRNRWRATWSARCRPGRTSRQRRERRKLSNEYNF
jgi:hypothetical protein